MTKCANDDATAVVKGAPAAVPHNTFTSRKARARAQRTLAAIARLTTPPPPDGRGNGNGNGDSDAQLLLLLPSDAPTPADTAIEARARMALTVADFCRTTPNRAAAAAVPGLPWPTLPPSADPASVLGRGVGVRGRKKRAQVANFAAVLRRLVALLRAGRDNSTSSENDPRRPLRVVDFGCGSGAVVLALAALFRSDEAVFVGLDMKLEAIDLLRRRAAEAGFDHVTGVVGMAENFCWGCCGGGGSGGASTTNHDEEDSSKEREHAFDVALALHACGNATDVAIELAARSGAAFAVSPCCLGKLRFSARGGSSFHPTLRLFQSTRRGDRERLPGLDEAVASQVAREAAAAVERRRLGCPWAGDGEQGGGRVRVRHPRSEWLRAQLLRDVASSSSSSCPAASAADAAADGATTDGVHAAFSAIARAADGVNHGEVRMVAKAAVAAAAVQGEGGGSEGPAPPPADGAIELRAARAAKAVVEMDRAEAMREAHGYAVAMLRLSPAVADDKEDGDDDGDGGDDGAGARDDMLVGVPGCGDRWAGARDAFDSLQTN